MTHSRFEDPRAGALPFFRVTGGCYGGALLLIVLLVSCAGPQVRPVTVGYEEVGGASWYGEPYHGRPTTSGEVYDMHQLTAAHRTLPIGTWVMVTNLHNGRSVEVRINDRGPFKEGRVIDLSYAAARLLDVVGPGVVPVRLRVTRLPRSADGTPIGATRYTVQVGSFVNRAYALALKEELGRTFDGVFMASRVIGGETYYRVRVGTFASREQASRVAARLAARGYRVLIVEQDL